MIYKTFQEENSWVSSKTTEFGSNVSKLSAYVKKGVLKNLEFYLRKGELSNDAIESVFGTKFLHELKVAESDSIRKDMNTNINAFTTIQHGKNVMDFRVNCILEKVSYDFDMNEGIMHLFLEKVFKKYDRGAQDKKIPIVSSSTHTPKLDELAKVATKKYTTFLINIDKRVSEDNERTASSVIKILLDSFDELKSELQVVLDTQENPQNKSL